MTMNRRDALKVAGLPADFHDWRKYRLVHPVYAIGGLLVVASFPLRMMIARSEWWQPVGAWIAKVGAGI